MDVRKLQSMVIDTSAAFAKISIFAQNVKQQYLILIHSLKSKFLALLLSQ
jgi:hypothetical protein